MVETNPSFIEAGEVGQGFVRTAADVVKAALDAVDYPIGPTCRPTGSINEP